MVGGPIFFIEIFLSLGMGIYLYFVIPRNVREYMYYRLKGMNPNEIPTSLEHWKYDSTKWWEFWKR